MNNTIRISNILKDLGVPVNVSGYKYLRDAIEITMKDMEKVYSICKKLYPEVANTFKTTPSRVERAMRHAIEIGFTRVQGDIYNKIFRTSVTFYKGKPTNAEFIATVADWLLMNPEE